MTLHQFPEGFLWGSATASFQIEGAATEDGRSDSIWDVFCRQPGTIVNGDDGTIACDHYHRMPEDVTLMRELGLNTYRFSIAWPRVRPDDKEFNPKGIDFYSRLVDELLAAGIRPWATLYHWDLPAAIDGGWLNRDTAYRFAEYAAKVAEALGDRCKDWTTLNEPWCSSFLSYAGGEHAPGHTDAAEGVRAGHHLLLAHGLGCQALRATLPADTRVGITLNFNLVDPADPESVSDREAARRIDGVANRFFLDPVVLGTYPKDVVADLEHLGLSEVVADGDEKIIGQPIDFLGVNYYHGSAVTGTPQDGTAQQTEANGRRAGNPNVGSEWVQFVSRGLPTTAMGWEIQPEGITRLLERLHRDYTGPAGIALYVTENGCAMDDVPNASGFVDDQGRVAYLRDHFIAAHEAVARGVDLRGYFVWSLLDNFEWAWGYAKRFGIVRVDYDTLERTPKASAAFVKEVAAANAVEA